MDSAFNFNGAPKQFGAVNGAINKFQKGLKKSAAKKTASGRAKLAAKDQDLLNQREHERGMQRDTHIAGLQQQNATMGAVVGHVLGSASSAQEHKQKMAQTRLGQKHELAKSSQEHMQKTDTLINTQNHEARMAGMHHENAMGAINAAGQAGNVSSIKLPNGGAASFRAPEKGQQFGSVGGEE